MVDWIISKAGEEAPVVLITLCEAEFMGWRQTGSVEADRECVDTDTGHVATGQVEHLLEPGPDPVS